ncbi:MAG: 5'/3'-nucleotidase SurE [Opitutaceae bacterium]|jgi:5'-nucleotidase|nr:5'/3'-nucleotidase SurE [Opitutaceae bacterium]
MKLLLTNDDGIASTFLHVLIRALRDAGHDLFVVAPENEQSWIGAAKSRHRPVRSRRAAGDFGCPAWTVDGTPADCVNIALAHLLPAAPDAVVSGINIGYNASLGFILASGTIGGAWEGAAHGLPGIALSQHLALAPETYEKLRLALTAPAPGSTRPPDALSAPGTAGTATAAAILAETGVAATLDATARRAAAFVPELVRATPPRSFIVHNLNFPYPCHDYSEIRRTVPARVLVTRLFAPQPAGADGAHHFVYRPGEDITPPDSPPTDRAAIEAGFISHTVLDYTRLGRL